MSRFAPRRLIAATLFLTTGLLIASADGPAAHAQGKKDKDKKEKVEKGPGKAGIELRKTYDRLTDVSAALPAGKDAGKVFDHAKRFYRDAVRRLTAEMEAAEQHLLEGRAAAGRFRFPPGRDRDQLPLTETCPCRRLPRSGSPCSGSG